MSDIYLKFPTMEDKNEVMEFKKEYLSSGWAFINSFQ